MPTRSWASAPLNALAPSTPSRTQPPPAAAPRTLPGPPRRARRAPSGPHLPGAPSPGPSLSLSLLSRGSFRTPRPALHTRLPLADWSLWLSLRIPPKSIGEADRRSRSPARGREQCRVVIGDDHVTTRARKRGGGASRLQGRPWAVRGAEGAGLEVLSGPRGASSCCWESGRLDCSLRLHPDSRVRDRFQESTTLTLG